MATPGLAAGAYAQMARITDAAAGIRRAAAATGGEDQGPRFTEVLKDALASVRQAGAKSDAQSQLLATGTNKANIVDVVTAVAETETAINTLVSVRDKVVAAYEQIMQMQISRGRAPVPAKRAPVRRREHAQMKELGTRVSLSAKRGLRLGYAQGRGVPRMGGRSG